MKQIKLLKKDKTLISIDERFLNRSMLYDSKYLMIPASTSDTNVNRSFILVKPSELYLFDKAKIECQLGSLYLGEDCVEESYFQPLFIETRSLSEVINYLNTIDKLNVVNNTMNEELRDSNIYHCILFLQVTLYDKRGKKIYQKHYDRKPSSDLFYKSYDVAKVFKEIYSGDVCCELNDTKKIILIDSYDKSIQWDMVKSTDVVNDTYLIGIPCVVTNTLSLCTLSEYINLNKISSFNICFTVYYDTKNLIDEISKGLTKGTNLEEYDDTLEDSEIFFDSRVHFNIIGRINYLLDYLAHTDFIINTTLVYFDNVYGTLDKDSDFDCLITYNIKDKVSKRRREITMNKNSVLSDNEILQLI